MKDKEVERIQGVIKDTEKIQQYFPNIDAYEELVSNLTTETARLTILRALVKEIGTIKRNLVNSVYDVVQECRKIQDQYDDLASSRKQIIEELDIQKDATRELSQQLMMIEKLVSSGDYNSESIKNITESSKFYITKCSKCSAERRGTLENAFKYQVCPKCQGQLELMVGVAPD